LWGGKEDGMRVGVVQMNSRTGARDENVKRAGEFVEDAARRGAELVVLPEFFNVEYFPQYRDYRYLDYAEPDDGYTQTRMRELARRLGIHIVSTIFEVCRPGFYYDTAMLIDPAGSIVGKYRKVHPAAYLSLEKIYFRGGSAFPTFRVGEWTLGVSICYDNLFPESCRCAALHGAELIVAPYATPVDDPWVPARSLLTGRRNPRSLSRRYATRPTVSRSRTTGSCGRKR
jgi:N-carbamoylputrescine amidase